MHKSREHLQTLTEIRSLMERSSKFLSLSGLSGVSAGLIALAGVGAALVRRAADAYALPLYDRPAGLTAPARHDLVVFLLLDAVVVLVLALLTGTFFTVRQARRQGLSVWNNSSRRLLWALAVPLAAGGLVCLALIRYNLLWLTFPMTLLFYGLALINGSKYTVRDVESLGYCEIGLGLLSLFVSGINLLAWAVGFGVLHIVYGLAMYYKYERNPRNPA